MAQNYYEAWLDESERVEGALQTAPYVARASELRWAETAQDHRTAMVIGPAAGFQTQGTSLLVSEIPPRAHTGSHLHGEEAVHVISGEGFTIIEGLRYDWHAGTTLHIPFAAEHRHVNTGDAPARYISAMTLDLDLFVKLGRLEQKAAKGSGIETDRMIREYPTPSAQVLPSGRRIALHLEDTVDDNVKHKDNPSFEHLHEHGASYALMGGRESSSDDTNGFVQGSVAMSHILEESGHTSSHKHSHTEAMLYVLEGAGYSEIEGERYDWSAGDAVHIPPKQTVHEHFNDREGRTRTIRIEFGIRYFYEPLWSGFAKFEIRKQAIAR